MEENQAQEAWFLRSRFPVLVPSHPALGLPADEFDAFLREDLANRKVETDEVMLSCDEATVADSPSATDVASAAAASPDAEAVESEATSDHPFVQGLLSMQSDEEAIAERDMTGKMLTANGDVAFATTSDALVDLFAELEESVRGRRLVKVLDAAWAQDSLATLKIIFNARSIHLGKSSRTVFYLAAGWLAQHHPLTLVGNLRWLSRPVIEKKVEKKETADGGGDDAAVLVDAADAAVADDAANPARFDVRNGVAHGYWKDLLNLLALAANASLDPLATPASVLNVAGRKVPGNGSTSAEAAKAKRQLTQRERHASAVLRFQTDAVYRALHLTVARLFAEQLTTDLAALRGNSAAARRHISLCAKWAPSAARFHDKHTFVVSSIAELLHPAAEFAGVAGTADRETYLRHARDAYRKDVSALRAHLDVVERRLSAGGVAGVDYERLPSQAMQRYGPLFAEKDRARFLQYLADVGLGKARISGATLLPSTLVRSVSEYGGRRYTAQDVEEGAKMTRRDITNFVADAQWRTLVQRIRDSGRLENSIAVCDVSGSMMVQVAADGTTAMDAAIGLSLVVSEVAEPPFRGHFISFSEKPAIHSVSVDEPLSQKVSAIKRSAIGFSTDFVAVFEWLILPMAVKNKIKQEDMVKRVFVFSDMQFNQSERIKGRWSTSYERIQARYRDAGYDMPELVFWNLDGGHALGEAPKPVSSTEPGTAIVSGFSQALLKVFMEGGSFDDAEEGDVVVAEEADGDAMLVDVSRKPMNPARLMAKAISHPAYSMLQVLD